MNKQKLLDGSINCGAQLGRPESDSRSTGHQCFLTLVNVNFNVSEIEISKINDSEIRSEKLTIANNDIDA